MYKKNWKDCVKTVLIYLFTRNISITQNFLTKIELIYVSYTIVHYFTYIIVVNNQCV